MFSCFKVFTCSSLSKFSVSALLRTQVVVARNYSKMPPIPDKQAEILAKIEKMIEANRVAIFSKSWCPFCSKVKKLFDDLNVPFHALELDKLALEETALYQEMLLKKTGMTSVPNVFVNGTHVGGCDDTFKSHSEHKLLPLLEQTGTANGMSGDSCDTSSTSNVGMFDYDLVVIGGGSGGLAASKEASKLNMKVAVCDFVKPTPTGTSWGLGGTCVNVGCIPKKLMHQSALLGQAMADASHFGWDLPEQRTHDWLKMVEAIQNHIGSLNWGYRVSLKEAKVNYLNEFAEFIDPHTIQTTNKKQKTSKITSRNFLIAVGGRPRYPDIPGARELGITSDDLFSLNYNPGKTLLIGASYIALECAGFLAGFGLEVTVMARSILLRGFDQQIAEMIGDHMEEHGVKFLRGWVPVKITKLEEGNPPKLAVSMKETNGDETMELECNTVVFAIGREPCTSDLKLENAGVTTSSSGKILTTPDDRSSAEHIFAIGDVAEGRPELTPVAIQAGVLLSRRLYGKQTTLTDYEKVPTTVFTPMEYGCIGLSEEDALEKYGEDQIETYHSNFQPLECTVPKRDENACYAKLVCLKSENERVVGFHYLGPNAGEVTQGFALGIRLGATKSDFDALIGIHPTNAEIFTTLNITKSSGMSSQKKGC